MRITTIPLLTLCSSICLAQTDSMFVEKMDGTIQGFPMRLISQITFSVTSTTVHEQDLIQKALLSFALHQNFPNPFNPSTTIQYSVPRAGDVEINIFDIQGRLVRALVKSNQQAGIHFIVWDSRGNSGHLVASGVYLCQVLFDGSALVKKLVLLK